MAFFPRTISSLINPLEGRTVVNSLLNDLEQGWATPYKRDNICGIPLFNQDSGNSSSGNRSSGGSSSGFDLDGLFR